jgi:uncharacterized membrane protein
MDPKVYDWLKAGHLIGDFIWVGSMFAVYWLLRFHTHAPKDAHEKLTLMERSMALMMDVSATLAIGTGVALIFYRIDGYSSLFAEPHPGWFHIKLTVVVLGMLSIHGMLRAKIKKFQMGKISPVPQWQWTVLLSSVVAILILVFVVRHAMSRSEPSAPASTESSTVESAKVQTPG